MEKLKKMSQAIKHIVEANHWFCSFVLPAMLILPILTAIGWLFDVEFITNGIDIYMAVSDALDAGMPVNIENLITAANVVLYAGLLSYIPPLLLMKRRNHEPGGYRKIEVNKLFKHLCLGMFLNAVVQFTTAFVKLLPIFSPYTEALEASNAMLTSGNPIFTVLSVGVIGPMVEEITLRRGVQKNLCKINPTFGLIATSVLFGVLHGNLIQNTGAIVIGLGLGYMYYKTDNLWYPTALHMAANLNSVFGYVFGLNTTITTLLLPVVFGVLWLLTKKKAVSETAIVNDIKETPNNKPPIKVKVKVNKIKNNKNKTN